MNCNIIGFCAQNKKLQQPCTAYKKQYHIEVLPHLLPTDSRSSKNYITTAENANETFLAFYNPYFWNYQLILRVKELSKVNHI